MEQVLKSAIFDIDTMTLLGCHPIASSKSMISNPTGNLGPSQSMAEGPQIQGNRPLSPGQYARGPRGVFLSAVHPSLGLVYRTAPGLPCPSAERVGGPEEPRLREVLLCLWQKV